MAALQLLKDNQAEPEPEVAEPRKKGPDESGIRRIPEAELADAAIEFAAPVVDLEDLLAPVPTVPPPPPVEALNASDPGIDFGDVLREHRPQIQVRGEQTARISIPPGLSLPPEELRLSEQASPRMMAAALVALGVAGFALAVALSIAL